MARHARSPGRSVERVTHFAPAACTPEQKEARHKASCEWSESSEAACLAGCEVVDETTGPARKALRVKSPKKTSNHALFQEYVQDLLEDYHQREIALAACSKAESDLSELQERRERALRDNDKSAIVEIENRLEHGFQTMKECMRNRMRIEGAMSFSLVSINKLAHLKYS